VIFEEDAEQWIAKPEEERLLIEAELAVREAPAGTFAPAPSDVRPLY
jgi:hypothetical protein